MLPQYNTTATETQNFDYVSVWRLWFDLSIDSDGKSQTTSSIDQKKRIVYRANHRSIIKNLINYCSMGQTVYFNLLEVLKAMSQTVLNTHTSSNASVSACHKFLRIDIHHKFESKVRCLKITGAHALQVSTPGNLITVTHVACALRQQQTQEFNNLMPYEGNVVIHRCCRHSTHPLYYTGISRMHGAARCKRSLTTCWPHVRQTQHKSA